MASRLVSCALSNLTRRVGGLSLAAIKPPTGLAASFNTTATKSLLVAPKTTPRMVAPASSLLPSVMLERNHYYETPFAQTTRTMVTRKKRLARRFKRRVEAKRAREAAEREGEDPDAAKDPQEETAAPQHEAWVEFQKSVAVKGFDTGQAMKARVQKKGESGQTLRDLKRREKIELKLQAKRDEVADIRGGEYPTMQYSDEETERLLKMAYAAIPKRAGKRGTRNLQRQQNRWRLVRAIHAKKKAQVKAAWLRKQAKLSWRKNETFKVKEQAVQTRSHERQYQKEVLRRWVQNLKQSDNELEGSDKA